MEETAVRSLFDEVPMGDVRLPNRLVMAPMGRCRAHPSGLPVPVMEEYYSQRASAGLIISESTNPSPIAVGHAFSARLYTDEHAAAWRRVTDAVHEAGGRIFLQILHSGRISHPSLHGSTPVAPSAVRPAGTARTYSGNPPYPVPRPLSLPEIAETVEVYAACAVRAVRAGFDGVEIHGANGYLVHQFLAAETNHRRDGYGGSITGRIRFAIEVAEAVAAAIGPGRVGMRLSPGGRVNDMGEQDAADVYPVLVRELSRLGLAYLHYVMTSDRGLVRRLIGPWSGRTILNMGTGELNAERTLAEARTALDQGYDLLSFARQFLANPDLPLRLRDRLPLNTPDVATFYEGGARGYTDYPFAELSSASEVR
jgi:N-ethylmaleimide reductase